MAEWSKAPDSSSGPRERAWVQIPLLTFFFPYFFFKTFWLRAAQGQLYIFHHQTRS
ncbi:hypothetical protein BT93_B3178 [Corymbia citriodora subsp. variegata]|nr:hypothetical protein BT93_B3178 [Corymbia citriodora subsp. variegata]